jgi:SPP1 family predicted phage head-tail adaptor
MRSENLNKRITIKQVTQTETDTSAISTFTDLATVWASVEPINGREFFAADTVNSEISVRIKIRYRSGIIPAMRIVYSTRTFEIISIIDYMERHTELQLMCKELI